MSAVAAWDLIDTLALGDVNAAANVITTDITRVLNFIFKCNFDLTNVCFQTIVVCRMVFYGNIYPFCDGRDETFCVLLVSCFAISSLFYVFLTW